MFYEQAIFYSLSMRKYSKLPIIQHAQGMVCASYMNLPVGMGSPQPIHSPMAPSIAQFPVPTGSTILALSKYAQYINTPFIMHKFIAQALKNI
jgi:hypothetical protein